MDSNQTKQGKEKQMKGSLIILFFFIVGTTIGSTCGLPEDIPWDKVCTITLCALMACVGFRLGNSQDIKNMIREMNPALLMLPPVSILGALAGCAAASLFTPFTLTENMAVGAGMGYYSLSAIMIGGIKGTELGTVALLANIMRELTAILLAPALMKCFGAPSAIAVGGATTADTTFPVITNACGREWIPTALWNGIITDFSVPFMVSALCAL